MPAITIGRARRVAPAIARRLICGCEPWVRYRVSPKEAESLGAQPGAYYLVAKRGRAVLGFACILPDWLLGEYLKLLVVDPALRSRGIGRRLMAHWERTSLRRFKNLYLCVSDFNPRARRFYKRLGFSEVGRLPDLVRRGCGEILMRKTCGPRRA